MCLLAKLFPLPISRQTHELTVYAILYCKKKMIWCQFAMHPSCYWQCIWLYFLSLIYQILSFSLRVCFFKKIQDWILKSEWIRKRILCFFSKQINPRYHGSQYIKGTEESTYSVDSSVPLTHHDQRDLRLICLVNKHKICFQILSDLRIQSWIFLKRCTLILNLS